MLLLSHYALNMIGDFYAFSSTWLTQRQNPMSGFSIWMQMYYRDPSQTPASWPTSHSYGVAFEPRRFTGDDDADTNTTFVGKGCMGGRAAAPSGTYLFQQRYVCRDALTGVCDNLI